MNLGWADWFSSLQANRHQLIMDNHSSVAVVKPATMTREAFNFMSVIHKCNTMINSWESLMVSFNRSQHSNKDWVSSLDQTPPPPWVKCACDLHQPQCETLMACLLKSSRTGINCCYFTDVQLFSVPWGLLHFCWATGILPNDCVSYGKLIV